MENDLNCKNLPKLLNDVEDKLQIQNGALYEAQNGCRNTILVLKT